MKVCWFGIYDPDYSRNSTLIAGLRMNGVEVIECNEQAVGLKKYFRLIKRLRALKNSYDVLYCAFPVDFVVLLGKFFQKKPIVVDAFFPMYDAVVYDRKLHSKYHPVSLMYLVLDRINSYFASEIVVDTDQHKEYWSRFNNEEKIKIIPVGANTKEFYPFENDKIRNKGVLVSFHGSYTPLQGIDKIVEAAYLLRNKPEINFRFIGKGQELAETKNKIKSLGLDIEIKPWLSLKDLNTALNEADIILGIFGDTEKTNRVVPNKLFQGIAVRKPVISMDTPAVRNLFSEEEIMLVNNSPRALADAIEKLADSADLRTRYEINGYHKFLSEYTQDQLGHLLVKKLETLLNEEKL